MPKEEKYVVLGMIAIYLLLLFFLLRFEIAF